MKKITVILTAGEYALLLNVFDQAEQMADACGDEHDHILEEHEDLGDSPLDAVIALKEKLEAGTTES